MKEGAWLQCAVNITEADRLSRLGQFRAPIRTLSAGDQACLAQQREYPTNDDWISIQLPCNVFRGLFRLGFRSQQDKGMDACCESRIYSHSVKLTHAQLNQHHQLVTLTVTSETGPAHDQDNVIVGEKDRVSFEPLIFNLAFDLQSMERSVLRILFVGDVFGSPGRRIVKEHLGYLIHDHQVDLVIVNAENSAGGFGVTPSTADELFDLGAHVLTTGNHIWDKKEIIEYLQSVPGDSNERPRRVVRPANYAPGAPGYGFYQGSLLSGQAYAVINLQGKVFMNTPEDPFRTVDHVLKQITAPVIFVDFHAEATSEKVAMGWYLDGRVTAIIGTHTHIPTADQRVLPGGTAYQTDAGMSGPYDGVIGVEKDLVLARFLTGMPAKFEPARNDARMCASLIDCDGVTGRATAIQRFMLGE
jgi:metallophosphoesterase (TIGR00282 family)